MGQNLSEPKTEKETRKYENDMFLVGVSSMQGWRVEMEDASTVQLPLVMRDQSSAYFAVFDGHGGPRFAEYCSDNLHKMLLAEPDFGEGNYRCALKSAILTLDSNLQEVPSLQFQFEPGGTTAITVLVKDNKLYCANVGDSRAIACVGGVVQELSHDHKPFNPSEESRIFKAGGWVEFNRVNGNLALSRAIGDFNFKENKNLGAEEQIISANPDIIVVDVTPEHEFIVLACDGVWDVMSNQEVLDFVRRRVADRMSPPMICEALLDHCLAPDCRMGGLGCDNMTVILACLLHDGESYSDLSQRCMERIDLERRPSVQDQSQSGLHTNTILANGQVQSTAKSPDSTTESFLNNSPLLVSKRGHSGPVGGATVSGASVERPRTDSSNDGETATDNGVRIPGHVDGQGGDDSDSEISGTEDPGLDCPIETTL